LDYGSKSGARVAYSCPRDITVLSRSGHEQPVILGHDILLFYPLSISLIVDAISQSFNTPADGYYTAVFRYPGADGKSDGRQAAITFLSTGEIDHTRTSEADLAAATTLLDPAISLLRLRALQGGINLDFWEFINWIVVSHYWTFLAIVGQVSPTMYPPISSPYFPEPFTANFSHPKTYPTTNNIFINATLFHIYSTYLTNTILPILGIASPRIAALDDVNKLQPSNRTFLRTYVCQIRQWKDPFGAFFAVITSVYVFTTGPFNAIILIARYFETRNKDQGYLVTLLS